MPVTNIIHETLDKEFFIPMDKQMQQTLIHHNHGVIQRSTHGAPNTHSKWYEAEYIDSSSLPSEYEDRYGSDDEFICDQNNGFD